MLITTRRKARLPRGLSYPVGAEIVSSALEGVPQYQDLYLWFDRPTSLARSTDWSSGPFPLLTTSYYPDPYFDRRWSVSIWAVPCAWNCRARQALVAEGLPRLRFWLTGEHPPIWFESSKHLRIHYDELTECLTFTEDGRP
ncbi:MAG: hypothetical protein ACK47B_12765 [Armatimonadota bacterium]